MKTEHQKIAEAIKTSCRELFGIDVDVMLAPSKNGSSADYATPIAMSLSKKIGEPPQIIAEKILTHITEALPDHQPHISGPGFVNVSVSTPDLLSAVALITDPENVKADGLPDVLIEFGSANPTGPLHVGHARGLVVGAALAKILAAAGHRVTTEYYVNDAGGQIGSLSQSLSYHLHLHKGTDPGNVIPPYSGAYMREMAKDYAESGEVEEIGDFAMSWCLDNIRTDLSRMGITFDDFVSEAEVSGDPKLSGVIGDLKAQGLIRTEEDGAEIFETTRFGDDKDRAVLRSNGVPTYFGNDLLNHARKARTHPRLITVLGEDHAGYVARIKAVVSATSDSVLDVPLVGMVHLRKNGKPVSMSKRAGTFETVSDLLDEVGPDVLSMTMLSSAAHASMIFDMDSAIAEGPQNPVWSVNYAHARLSSALSKAESFQIGTVGGEMSPHEREVARLIVDWPRLLSGAAADLQPHRVATFSRDLASAVNAWWTAGNKDTSLRILLDADPDGNARRVLIAKAAKSVLAQSLETIGVAPQNQMDRDAETSPEP